MDDTFRPVIYRYNTGKRNLSRFIWFPCKKYLNNDMNNINCNQCTMNDCSHEDGYTNWYPCGMFLHLLIQLKTYWKV